MYLLQQIILYNKKFYNLILTKVELKNSKEKMFLLIAGIFI